MNLFETTVHAAEAAGPGPDAGLINLIMLGGFVVIFYFLLIRPQNKRRKEHETLVGGLSKGDEVVTAGGIVGQITTMKTSSLKYKLVMASKCAFKSPRWARLCPRAQLSP